MKRLFLILIICLCTSCNGIVLDTKFTGDLQLETYYNSDTLFGRISGFSRHSSCTVSRIKEIKKNNDIIISVFVSAFNSSKKGDFEYTFKIDSHIKRILYGKEKEIIWKRKYN